MTLDLIFSAVMLIASVYCWFYIGGVNNGSATELGSAFWPRTILVLMIILLVVNLIQIIRKKNGKAPVSAESVKEFFKSKLFLGMVVVAVTAIILPYIGFIPTCVLFLIVYGLLLGERRPVVLILTAIIATLVLYVVFQGPLRIFLPRGYGILRNFALAMESLLSMIGF